MMNDEEIRAKVQTERVKSWGQDSVNWTLLEKYEGVGFEDLTILFLSYKQLTSLPDSIRHLLNLKLLNLACNQLTSLPDSIGKLRNLKNLTLSENQLTSLPDSIRHLVNLESLDLSENQLTSLPDSIGKLRNLKSLNLRNNQLTLIPDSIGKLRNLTRLDLTDNPITPMTKREESELRQSGANLIVIKAIINETRKHRLRDIVMINEEELRAKVQAERVDDWGLDSVNWTLLEKYEGVGFEDLTSLDLGDHQLTSIPDSIGNLVNLTYLYLGENQLTSIPDSIGNLVYLTELNLELNQLTSLPDSIGNLVNLTELFLHENQLTSLPDSIRNLVNLTTLFLYTNRLTSLPNSLKEWMVNLTCLGLSENSIKPMTETEKSALRQSGGNPVVIKAIIDAANKSN